MSAGSTCRSRPFPTGVKAAFISAEDKNFYQHSGLDYYGIGRALVQNVESYGSGQRLVGASTITQQVAKNFLLTSEQTFDRKIKEAMLALRIEQAYSKDKILELYLNEIFLGLGSYGVAAASLDLFRQVGPRTDAAGGGLSGGAAEGRRTTTIRSAIPSAAIERRNWVIDRMVENGYATAAEGEAAKKAAARRQDRAIAAPRIFAADYFAEEVRRQLNDMFGEKTLYEGGLSVRTSLDPAMQVMARQALMDGWSSSTRSAAGAGRSATSTISAATGASRSARSRRLSDVHEWRLAVVLSVSDGGRRDRPPAARSTPGGKPSRPTRDTGIIPLDADEMGEMGDRRSRRARRSRVPATC